MLLLKGLTLSPADQFVNRLCRVDLRNAARWDEIEEPGLVAPLPSHLVVTTFSIVLTVTEYLLGFLGSTVQ